MWNTNSPTGLPLSAALPHCQNCGLCDIQPDHRLASGMIHHAKLCSECWNEWQALQRWLTRATMLRVALRRSPLPLSTQIRVEELILSCNQFEAS